jgi:very-short-patch-repair endonuclease
MADEETPTMRRRRLRCRVEELASRQDGIVSRAQIRDLGLTRFDVRTQVRAGRWQKPSLHTVAMFTGQLNERQHWWVAVLETGCGRAALDGATALQAAGLQGYTGPTTISCPHGATARQAPGVDLRSTRWRRTDDCVGAGIPRLRPARAAVHGALWARTDRQAALLVVMSVQQRLTTARRVRHELEQIKRHPRRRWLTTVVDDVVDGARALGELDFARLCRRRGLPEPSRQVPRRGPRGRVYLDVYFDQFRLVVEIDGGHELPGNQVDDALRQNELAIGQETVLRIPLLGLRIQSGDFMDQLARALASRGWQAAA